MQSDFKPEGYNSVSPYFVCDEPEAFADFLKKVFDGKELRKFTSENNKIVHAEMKLYDSVIMYSGSNENYPANKLLVHIYLPDVDQVFKKAIDYGCRKIDEPVQHTGEADKRGNFEDPWKNLWSIATQMKG